MNEVSSTVENYDRGTVIYDIYFQQKSLWPILLFSSRKLGELRRLYSYSQNLGLTNKHQETSVNKCHEHILLITSIIYYWFTYIFIYWYSFFNDAMKDFRRDYTDRSVLCYMNYFKMCILSCNPCADYKLYGCNFIMLHRCLQVEEIKWYSQGINENYLQLNSPVILSFHQILPSTVNMFATCTSSAELGEICVSSLHMFSSAAILTRLLPSSTGFRVEILFRNR